MQDDLFGGPPPPPPPPEKAPARRTGVHPAAWGDDLRELAARLPPTLRLGTSSWSYPGWQGLVWEGEHSEQTLAKKGLPVYAQHPLLRTVSIDRSFYRPSQQATTRAMRHRCRAISASSSRPRAS